MQAIPLHDGLTRAAADAALADAVPAAPVRAFLLQNLRLGTPPVWRIGLDEIAAALADVEGWDGPTARPRPKRPIPAARCSSPARPPTTSARDDRPIDPRAVPRRPLRDREARRALAARRQSGRLPRRGGGIPQRPADPMRHRPTSPVPLQSSAHPRSPRRSTRASSACRRTGGAPSAPACWPRSRSAVPTSLPSSRCCPGWMP